MITMDDIIRDEHPTLRTVAEEVSFPLDDQYKKLASDMIEFLKNSQDEEIAKKYDLRAGVGSAPQLDVSKNIIRSYSAELEDSKPLVWL